MNTRTTGTRLTGVQRYTLELCERLGDRVERIAPRRPLHGAPGHLWEQLVLPWRVRGRVLWSPGNAGPLAVGRQVVTIHDASVFDRPESFSAAYARWYQALLPRLVERVAAVIAVSRFTRDRLVALTGVRPDKVRVIHNGVTRLAPPPAMARTAVLAAHDVRPGRYLLTVGSIEPRKNLAMLLEGWRLARPRLAPDARLVVVGGEGSERVFGRSDRSAEAPGVVRAGYVDTATLAALYADTAALASVSLYEGFGLPLLEAASAGAPVVASDIPAYREVLADAARFVSPTDPAAIAEAIVELLEDERAREELRARGATNLQRFDWNRAAEETMEVLGSV